MDGLSSTSLGAAAAGILKSPEARGIIAKFLRKMWKKIRLKKIVCLIVNDIDRKDLRFKFPDDKFQYLDVEQVYLSLLSDGECSRLRDLKKINSRSWIISVKSPCKKILNTVREAWRKESVILCMSNYELAKELGIPNKQMTVFVQDKDYNVELMDLVPDDVKNYLEEMRVKHSKLPHLGYKSADQLKEMLENKFKNNLMLKKR